MRALPLVLLLCASGWAAGCKGDDDASGDPGMSSTSTQTPSHDDPGEQLAPGTRKLELTGSPPTRVGLSAKVKLRGRLLDEHDKPVEGATVSFALTGRVQDSSIGTLDSVTDRDGVFENTLIAGDIATAFRLRIVSEGAIDLFIDIAVSDAGFGTLLVMASYQGTRLITHLAVFAQPNIACSDVERMPGDPEATLSTTETQAQLPALPAGTRYAVTAVAENDSNTVLARGCVDGVAITADSVAKIEVAFTDSPLKRAGTFALQAEMESKAPASVISVALLGAADSLVAGDATHGIADNPEASFLLDTLDLTLRSDSGQPEWPALADAVAQDRAQQPIKATPDHELQGLLEINDQGPLAAITRMAALTQADLERLRVTGELTLTASGSPAATFRPTRIEALASEVGQKPMAIDLGQQAIEATTKARFVATQDALEVSSLSFQPQLGALASQVLEAVMSVDAPGHGGELRDLIGCSSIEEWLDAQSYSTGSSCNADCIATVCEKAVTRLLGAAERGLAALDDTRPNWTLSGTFALVDNNGDLLTEQMTCDEFDGQWGGAAGSGIQAAALSGTADAKLIMLQKQ